MPTLAATATHASGTSPVNLGAVNAVLLLTGVALVLLASYAIACAVRPFKPCRRCRGHGDAHGRRRHCPPCNSTGWRLRLGRRLWNALSHDYPDPGNNTGNDTGTKPSGPIVGLPPFGRDR